jgi:hypothetical protein
MTGQMDSIDWADGFYRQVKTTISKYPINVLDVFLTSNKLFGNPVDIV